MEGNKFCALFALHDGPMSVAICRVTLYCHANAAQLWFSLNKTGSVTSLWWYGACLSRTEGIKLSQIPL